MIGADTWNVMGGRALGPAPFLLAGIVNVTPDSFYDGGRYRDLDAAVEQGRSLARDGAHILDVGGESTRPGAAEVPEAEELARVIPVIRELARLPQQEDLDGAYSLGGAGRFTGGGGWPVLAVDTYKARVAAEALDAGAVIVNDISACRFDPELADVLADRKPGYVLMHSLGRPGVMQDDPRYEDVVGEILAFFEQRLHFLTARGVPEANIVLDPGVGFGKLLEHNMAVLRSIERFGALGRPIYMGLSNKSLWGRLLGLEPGQRQTATAVATALLVARGVLVHRVHEVGPARQAAIVATAMGRGEG